MQLFDFHDEAMLRKRLWILVVLFFPVAAVAASLPKGVFTLSELQDAKAQASEKRQPLVFVLSDLKTNCPLCQDSTKDIFRSFRSLGTLVYISSPAMEIRSAPPMVLQMNMNPSSGNIIPIVFVTNADATKPIKIISYQSLKGGKVSSQARALEKELENIDVLGNAAAPKTEPEPAPEPEPSKDLADQQDWENTEGQTIQASIKRIEGDHVVFGMPTGKEVRYPISKLSEASRTKIQSLGK